MELVQELQKALGGPACRTLPVEALGAQMQRATQGGTLALRWRRHFDLVALATPAALDVGFIGEMGTGSVSCNSVFVLYLCRFLNQEDLMKRETMVQNP